MIITEIFVPSLDKSFDFRLNENVPIEVIIDEISSVICQKEQCAVEGDGGDFVLFKPDTNEILQRGQTLYTASVRTADRLIFI